MPLSTTPRSSIATQQPVGPIHPGAILDEEFLKPLGLSAYALAKAISVPRNRVTGIVHGERAITADTALRLARFFDMSPDFWLGLQMTYDLETTRAALADRLDQEVVPRAARSGLPAAEVSTEER